MEQCELPEPKRKKLSVTVEKRYPFPICEIATTSSSDKSKINLRHFVGKLQNDCVVVTDKESKSILFNMGYFGKGTLSRGEPLFDSSPDVSVSSSQSTENQSSPKSVDGENVHKRKRNNSKSGCDEVENLQLTFEEAFFLSYGLGRLVVKDNKQPLDIIKLWQKLCELSPRKSFPAMYTVYHHFRSKGWVVRCGIKYGADYVLYKDGPPFYHSTYTVIVKSVREKDLEETELNGRIPMTWATLSSTTRINGHTGKSLIIVYVITPELTPEQMASPLSIYRFKVQEQLIKRWVPSEER